MKKLSVLLMALGFFVSACNNNKTGKNQNLNNRDKDDYGKNDNRNNDDENKTNDNTGNTGWSEMDKNKLIKECVASLGEGQEALANQICPCLLGKMEKEFTSYNEAETKGGEAASNRIAVQCKDEIVGKTDNTNTNVAVGWPQAEKDAFISNCVTTAMAKGKSRSVSQNYCDCMLNKMESLIPDIQDVAKLTQEDLESPAMKKMATDCLNDN